MTSSTDQTLVDVASGHTIRTGRDVAKMALDRIEQLMAANALMRDDIAKAGALLNDIATNAFPDPENKGLTKPGEYFIDADLLARVREFIGGDEATAQRTLAQTDAEAR